MGMSKEFFMQDHGAPTDEDFLQELHEAPTELTPASILPLFETSKEQRSQFVVQIMDRIDNGEIDVLRVQLQIKSIEDIISQLTDSNPKTNKLNFELAKKYKKYLVDAAEQYKAKSFELYKAKFEIKEVGTRYDYSQCNDPELTELQSVYEKAKEALDKRQKFLQSLSVEGLDIITKDGEGIKVFPPAKSSTTSVSVSLK